MGSEDFGCVTVKIYLNTLLTTTDSPSVPLTVIPSPPPKKKKPPTLSVLHDLNDIWFQIAKGTFEISLTGERERERERETEGETEGTCFVGQLTFVFRCLVLR